MPIDAATPTGPGPQLNSAPPRPPGNTKGVLQLGRETAGNQGGIPMGDPSVRIMAKLGNARQVLLDLASDLPPLASGIQQMIDALTQAVPQMMADIVSGQPPGTQTLPTSGISQAPTAPPTATTP